MVKEIEALKQSSVHIVLQRIVNDDIAIFTFGVPLDKVGLGRELVYRFVWA